MICMSKINDIYKMRREGRSVSEIARTVGVCRGTAYKYLEADDITPEMPSGSAAVRSSIPPCV